MNPRRLGAVLLILVAGIILLWLYAAKNNKTAPPANQPATPPAEQAATPPTGQAATTAPNLAQTSTAPTTGQAPATAAAESWFEASALARSVLLGSTDPDTGFLFELDVVNSGAAVNTLKLSRYFATAADKHLYNDNPRQYEQLRQERPEKYRGHYSLLNPLVDEQRNASTNEVISRTVSLPLATGRLTVLMDGGEPLVWNLANRRWAVEDVHVGPDGQSQSVRLSWTLLRGTQPFLRVYKAYRIVRGDYTVYMSLSAENLSDRPLKLNVEQVGPTGVPREDPRSDLRKAVWGRYNPASTTVEVIRRDHGKLSKMQLGVPEQIGTSTEEQPVVWVGVANKFFASMLYLVPRNPQNIPAPEWAARFQVQSAQELPTSLVYVPSVLLTQVSLAPGQSSPSADFEVFAGPKKRDLFISDKDAHHRPLYKRLNYLGTIDLGGCFLTPAWLTLGMMWLLGLFSVVSLGNYGVAIILLVFVVRLVLHPLAKKSQVSMMQMQKMAPQMQKLKEKYADNKDALNREMAAMTRKQGAPMLMGCLPMLLQMPIWFALFTALNASVELRHAGFLPFWITDLANPDVVFSWPEKYSLWTVGHQIHLLPILLSVAMLLQAKLTTQAPATSPEQQQQQKMMKWMMPIMMLFFFYSAPSGLTLYIMASTFAGVVEQMVIRRHIRQREAEAAAAETTVSLPGKGARTTRPKKPRGPLWFKRG